MLARFSKYHDQLNTIDLFKIIALFFMFIDHIGFYFLNRDELFFDYGRIAAPIFFFLVGYNVKTVAEPITTSFNFSSASFRMLCFGCILTASYYVLNERFQINILLNMLLIRFFLSRVPIKNYSIFLIIPCVFVFLILHLSARFHIEYGFLGLCYGLAGQLLYNDRRKLASFIIFMTLLVQFSFYFLRTSDPIPLIISAAIIWIGLGTFHFKTFEMPALFKKSLLLCSRYTLEIYFAHLFLFQLYALILTKNA